MAMTESPEQTLDRLALHGFGFLLVFLASSVALVLGVSAVGWSWSRPVLAACLFAAAALGVLVSRRLPRTRLEYRREPSWVAWLASVAAVAWILQFVRVFRLCLERPIYDWDGLYYHLPAVHGWWHAGRVSWLGDLSDLPFSNGYSMGTEVLGSVGAVLGADGRLLDATTLVFWPLGLLAVVVLSRQVGASTGWAWFAGAATAQIPSLVSLSTTLYVDAAFAIAIWCAVAASVRWFGLQSRATAWDAVLVGSALGLAATVKGMGWVLGLVLGAFLLWLWFRSRVTAPRAALQLVVVVSALVAVAGYWPVRNVVHTGNPIYPLELRVGEKLLQEGYQPHRMVEQDLPDEWAPWPPALRPLKSWVTFDSHRHGHNAVGGLGILWLGLGLPSWIWLSVRRKPSTWPRWLAAFALVVLLLQPGAWWSRFTLWLPGIGLAAAALACAITGGGRWARLCQVGVVVVFAAAILESDAALRWEARQGRDASTGTYLSSFEYYFPQFTEQEFAPGFLAATHIARSRWGRMGTLFGGALCQPLGARQIRNFGDSMNPHELSELRAEGVSWVVWDAAELGPLDAEVRDQALEHFVYRAEPAIDFEFLRLD